MAQPHMSGSSALPSEVTDVMANMNGMKIMSSTGVTRGRKPWRNIMIPSPTPPNPITSMAAMPTMNICSIHHGVK